MLNSFNSVIPFFVVMPLLVIFAALLAKYIPFYKRELKAEEKERYESIDGLRGLLALGVFFQHAATNHLYYMAGFWQISDSKFYRFLGGESVILFFMITSFLYWSKAIRENGKLDVASLYRSRVMRLAPMYLFSALLIVFFAFLAQGSLIHSLRGFASDIASWLTLGLKTTTTFQGQSIIPINAGIHWTLHFEWVFYLLLPVAAVILRDKFMRYLALPLFVYIFLTPDWGYWVIFLFGVAAAHIVDRYKYVPQLKHSFLGIVPILGLIGVYVLQDEPYSVPQYALTFCIFLFFIYGNTIFGLLKLNAIRFLGTVSYSVYLMHGIVLYVVLHAINKYRLIVSFSPTQYWSLMLLCGLLTIFVSSFTYRYIENPFLLIAQKKKTDSAIDITERVI